MNTEIQLSDQPAARPRLSPVWLAAWMPLVVVWTGAILALLFLRDAAFAAAETNISNLTRVIAAQTALALGSAEGALFTLRDSIEKGELPDGGSIESLLNARAKHPAFLHPIEVIDESARVVHSSAASGEAPVFDTDSGYFAAHRQQDDRDMLISRPARSADRQVRGIPLSVRIDAPDHQFRGVVAATLDAALFETMFKDLDLGAGSSITLQRADYVVLLRQPFAASIVGRTVVGTPLMRALEGQDTALVHMQSIVDGQAKVMGARTVDGFPVRVVVAVSEASVLRVWRAQATIIVGSAAALSFLLLVMMRQSDIAARLHAKNQAVRALVEASPRPVATLRRNGTGGFVIEWISSPFAGLLGMDLATSSGEPFSALLETIGMPGDSITLEGIKEARIDGSVGGLDGPIEVQLIFTPVKDGNRQVDTILVTARDVSAERQSARREAERHLLEALGGMAGRIAHEINNVLQPIMSHASLALHACRSAEEAQIHLREIQSGVRNGRQIVRSVLSLAGSNARVRQPVLVEAEIASALDLIRPSLPERISLDVGLDAAGLTVVLAPGDVFQILSNLMVNAVDAIAATGTIHVEAARHEVAPAQSESFGIAPGGFVGIAVSDTGCGMNEDTLRRAITPFFTTKPVGRGAGLGLSTVQTLVGSLRGSMTLTSATGKGTTVLVMLPLAGAT